MAATRGANAAAEYYAAYILEKSLSVNNIFVFIIILSELWFGVAGALVFRAIMIGAGVALIERFRWAIYPFAALILFAAWRLLFTAGKMLASDWIHISPGLSILVIAVVLLATVGASVWAASPGRARTSARPAPVRATKSVAP